MNQGGSSTGLSIQPLKRRRGRPPKDPSLKRLSPGYASPHPNRAGQNLLQWPSPAEKPEPTVGQPVTGIIMAALDAGYLINVQIGNSPATFRGIVFKPGHYVPVTKENDVAPHLQMIKRNDVHVPGLGDGLYIQPAMRQKRKYTRRAVGPTPIHPASQRGSVVPVVLQPVTHNFSNGLQTPGQGAAGVGQMLDSRGKDVHMVEPPSVHMVDASRPVPPHAQIGSRENEESFGEGGNASSVRMDSSNYEIGGSLDTSDSQYENGKEVMTSPLEKDDSGAASANETGTGDECFPNDPLQNVSVFSYARGRMTELLQAVHMKEKQVQFGEHPIPGAKIELREMVNKEADPKSGP